MPAPEVVAVNGSVGFEPPVWIEDCEGTIVRGVALSLTREGACVQLARLPGFGEGAAVALRFCLEPGGPTVARTAQVTWLRAEGGWVDCDLAWIESGGPFEEWLGAFS